MKKNINYRKAGLALLVALASTIQMSCKKLIDVKEPITSLTSNVVYSSNTTASAVLTGILAKLSTANSGDNTLSMGTASIFIAFSGDELTLTNPNDVRYGQYWKNALSNQNGDFWNTTYPNIYICNAAIDGLNQSTLLTPAVKQELLGEAKFLRAFFYFYLVNLYGDVPLVITTDYTTNAQLPRSPKDDVMTQVIADLKDAQTLLSTNYVDAKVLNQTAERVRPNKWAATAMLARAYLYKGDYANAVTQSSLVIGNTAQYSLEALNNVFLKNNNEAIWQIQATGQFFNANTGEGLLFKIPATGPDPLRPAYMSNSLVNSFEAGDNRKANWVSSVDAGGTTYYFPYKYKIGQEFVPTSEYSTVLRLGEQYLVRAEAYAQLGKITEAADDINVIRTRAGLANTTAATKETLLTAVAQERRVELFTEWGHRWFDLKRTGKVDEVMSVATPIKSGTWEPYKALYPLPFLDLNSNNKLKQNPGY